MAAGAGSENGKTDIDLDNRARECDDKRAHELQKDRDSVMTNSIIPQNDSPDNGTNVRQPQVIDPTPTNRLRAAAMAVVAACFAASSHHSGQMLPPLVEDAIVNLEAVLWATSDTPEHLNVPRVALGLAEPGCSHE